VCTQPHSHTQKINKEIYFCGILILQKDPHSHTQKIDREIYFCCILILQKVIEDTITNIPSFRVGNSSSFLNVSSPTVTLPKIAYWRHVPRNKDTIYKLYSPNNQVMETILCTFQTSTYLAIKMRGIAKKHRE